MKTFVKQAAVAICFIILSPFILVTRLEGLNSRSEKLFQLFGQLLSLIPGIPGSYFRKSFYWSVLSDASWDFHIDFGSFFSHRTATVSRGVIIGSYSIIGCTKIGENVLIASRVSITSGKNTHKDAKGNIVGQNHFSTVEIGARTWIGEGCVIMDNVGEDSIVSAGSVVTKPAPGNIVAIGNPARFIPRFEHIQQE